MVENLQRLLRPQILSELGIKVAESVFDQDEAGFAFANDVRHLEDLRRELRRAEGRMKDSSEEALQFYRSLLQTPVAERPDRVSSQIMRQPLVEKRTILERYSAIRRRLTKL